MLRPFLNAFWNEDVWLPPNTTWADLAPGPDKTVTYTDHRHVLLPIPMALVFIALRFVLEKYVFAPFGKSLGIKDGRNKKATPNAKLEAAYRANPATKRNPPTKRGDYGINIKPLMLLITDYGGGPCHSSGQLAALAKLTDMTERQVERWWRLRRSQDKPSTLVKFCENAWKCSFYVCNFVFGIAILWNKKWLWDIDHAYIGYPHQGLTNDVWWYYMISSAFYWSLTLSQFRDVKRKDFWQMFVHHLATIMLLSFSWVCNLHRIGTLVLLVHDCADIFVEAVKATKYANYQRTCDTLFLGLIVSWITTRIFIYPYYIIWSTLIRAPMLLPMFPAYYIFNSLLCLLLVLHVVWTWLILQIAYKAIYAGKMDGDIRSSSDVSDSSNRSNGTPARPHKD